MHYYVGGSKMKKRRYQGHSGKGMQFSNATVRFDKSLPIEVTNVKFSGTVIKMSWYTRFWRWLTGGFKRNQR